MERPPAGVYTVKVQPLIDKEGNITNVVAISIREKCIQCATKPVKVISNGSKWEPACKTECPLFTRRFNM